MRALLLAVLIALAGPAAAGEYAFPEIGLTVRFPDRWLVYATRPVADPAKDTLSLDDVQIVTARDPRLQPILQLTTPPAPGLSAPPSLSVFLIRHPEVRLKADPRFVLRRLTGIKLLVYRNFELVRAPRLVAAGDTMWFRTDGRYKALFPGAGFRPVDEETWVRGGDRGYLVVDVRTDPKDEATRISARAIIAAISFD